MQMCVKCGQNPAIIYISKIEGETTKSEGYCLSCAKQLGIAPLNSMIEQMGISDEEIDMLNSQMADFQENMTGLADGGDFMELMNSLSNGEEDEGGAATTPLSFMSCRSKGKECSKAAPA